MTAAKEPILDFGLMLVEPIEIGVQVIFVEALQAQDVTGGMSSCQPHGGQPGALVDDSGQNLPSGLLGVLRSSQGGDDTESFGHGPEGKDCANDQALFGHEIVF